MAKSQPFPSAAHMRQAVALRTRPGTGFFSVILSLFMLSQPSVIPAAEAGSYILMVGNDSNATIDLYNLTSGGKLSHRSELNIRDDIRPFGDPWDFIFSQSGQFLFAYDYSQRNGALYRVTPSHQFNFLYDIHNGCGGGGFSRDEEYFFTVTDCVGVGPTTYTLQAYSITSTSCTLVTSKPVPYFETVAWNYQLTIDDEILGGGIFDFSPHAFTVYQFDRKSQTLMLKQREEGLKYLWSDLSPDEKFVVFTYDPSFEVLARGQNGLFEHVDSYSDPDWRAGTRGDDLYITPDSKHVLALLWSVGSELPSGPIIFRVGEDYSLEFLHRHPLPPCETMAMSPDGKFIAVAWWDGASRLSIFHVTTKPPYFEETTTITHSPRIGSLRFHPQAMPTETGAGSGWDEYVRRDGWQNEGSFLFEGKPHASPRFTSTALLRRWLPGPWRLPTGFTQGLAAR